MRVPSSNQPQSIVKKASQAASPNQLSHRQVEMRDFKDNSIPSERPERHQRKMMRPPKAKSKPADFEPEIGVTDGIRRKKSNYRRPVAGPRGIITKLTNAIDYWRRMITVAARPKPPSDEPLHVRPNESERRGRAVARAVALGISICFVLLVVCGIVIAALFAQIRDMKVEIAFLKQHFATTDAHLSRLEEIAQQKITKEAKMLETPPPPQRVQISLNNDDIKLIRSSIKVLPSQPGAQPKVHLGQEISNTSIAPVPESLVTRIPKLRGARFLVDDNGAIVIVGDGSNRADVVVDPQ
jgi:hypothetical protein